VKSPTELASRLALQWHNPALREQRLLDEYEWPIRLSIGRPPAEVVAKGWTGLTEHIRKWRAVCNGVVRYEQAVYRATEAPIEIPVTWELTCAEEWIKAADDDVIAAEYTALSQILRACHPIFYSFFTRNRSLWRNKPIGEIVKAAKLAETLGPGSAKGKPLRSFSIEGIDTKFFERHNSLISRLLDVRFDGEVGKQGLEAFLDAWQESDHWMLVADLDGTILPFDQQRVRSKDLTNATITPQRVLVVENEKCLHLLPKKLPGVIVVLGCGNSLGWLAAPWVQASKVAYWGDIDTWGLTLLASARAFAPHLFPILMTREVFGHHLAKTVPEPVPARSSPPQLLMTQERDLYFHLLTCERGRLEQEFLADVWIANAIEEWIQSGKFVEPKTGNALGLQAQELSARENGFQNQPSS